MAKVDINIIKEWFRNLKKPNQEQFWSWLDSFRHKDEAIPMSDVSNLTTTLTKKADLINGVVPENQLPFTINSNEVIYIGEITTTTNSVTVGVHSSGSNKVRINGQILTRNFSNILPFTPVTTGNKFLRIVARAETGLFFLREGSESEEPQEPALQSGDVHVRLILVTPTGSQIDPEVLSGFVEKEEESWKTITVSSSTNFSINITDKRTRFKVRSTNDIPKVLQSIVFSEETSRALEIWIYNDTNLNFSIPNSATNGLSKGFTTAQPPFIILPKTYEKLKYNPETNIIECWKVNATSGSSFPITGNNGDILEKDSTAQNGAKWVDRLGGLTANFLSLWNGSKFINSIISQVSSKIGINNTSPAEMLDVGGRVKANSFVAGSGIGTAVPYEFGFKDGLFGYADASGVFKPVAIFEHQLKGKVLTATGVNGTYNCDLNVATRWHLTLNGATTLAFTNMIASDETITGGWTITGSYTVTFASWLSKSPGSADYDGSKVNRITFEITKGGSSPLGRYSIEVYNA